MKLQNKKTGEIAELGYIASSDGYIILQDVNTAEFIVKYGSLTELNEVWEDYEEPKDFWFIDPEILIACESTDPLLCDKKVAVETMKQIGNYFETREEAEKAVEKLKAWKRLKDKGFKFTGVAGISNNIIFETDSKYDAGHVMYDEYSNTDNKLREYNEDLMLLFGGEE